MCGICGIYNFRSSEPVALPRLETMNTTLYHRGPNDEGYYVDGSLGIAMRRLSIIDVAGGKQPIHNEDESIWIVFNGEIFNYPELSDFLKKKGHSFYTSTDTEAIVHLYEEFGEDCVHHLRGMFAFAIWDSRARILLLARDRVGIKPLFYAIVSDNRFFFASEPKALLTCPTVDRSIDLQALDAYFAYGYVPAPLSIYGGIRKLLPGHLMKITPAGVAIRKYWDLYFQPDYGKSESYFIERFDEIFSQAVKMRLLSEVPLGAFLSGGVDSSLVVAHMARSMSSAPRTFTVGFGGDSASHLDERPYARTLAHQYRCEHTEILVEPKVTDILAEVIAAFDEPFADDSVIPSYYICQASKEKVTVALTGLGGDELFAGYERYLGLRLSQLYDYIPYFVSRNVIRPVVESLAELKSGHYLVNHMKRFVRASHLPLPERYASYVTILPPEERKKLFSPDAARQIDFEETARLMTAHYTSDNVEDPLDRAFYQDIKTYLPDDILALTDRIGMLHSQELRVPFTDHVLMEFCATIPSQLKLKNVRRKYLLKRAATHLLPPEVLAHRKQGFSSPMAQWIKDDLKPLIEERLSYEAIQASGILSYPFVKKTLAEHLTARQLHDRLIFATIMFREWQEHDDARAASPPESSLSSSHKGDASRRS
jgi:asparagine synthase (glutamine-hydrolysing)